MHATTLRSEISRISQEYRRTLTTVGPGWVKSDYCILNFEALINNLRPPVEHSNEVPKSTEITQANSKFV